jgi:glycosyltransferase involved in cell wall biosynthesis
VRRYVTELTRALRQTVPDIELVAIGAPAATLPDGVRSSPSFVTLPTNLGWAAVGLPLAARRVQCDVFHAPAYTAPLWGVRPIVLTLHDVAYARRPEWYPHAAGPVRQAFYRASARRADHILTDSAFSRSEIVAAYGIDADRIHVVPLGVDEAFTPDHDIRREPVVLHVGDLHTRRNLGMLLDAVLDVRRAEPACRGLRLVLVGRDRGVLEALSAQAAAAGDSAALHHAGQPDDAELIGWYRRAAVLAYPSRYEGFGLPVLEAMACGTPVVASTSGAVPEVTGDAAWSCDPDDARGWREALAAVIARPDIAADRSARGLARASAFSWAATARATAEVYGRAMGARR